MTTKQDIGTLIGEWVTKHVEAKAAYAQQKEVEFEIQAYMRENYPDEWRLLQSGQKPTFTAEGVTLTTTRTYDLNALRAEIGEEHPGAFKQVTTEKVDGNYMRKLWADAAVARRISKSGALLPGTISVKVK